MFAYSHYEDGRTDPTALTPVAHTNTYVGWPSIDSVQPAPDVSGWSITACGVGALLCLGYAYFYAFGRSDKS